MRGAQERADHHVLQHRHAFEGLRHLEGARQPELRPRLRRHAGDVVAFEQHLARGRHEIAGQAIEEGRLAGAVRPDQAENVALLQRHAGGIDRLEAAKGFCDVAGFKEHWRLLPRPARRRLAPCPEPVDQRQNAARLEARDDHDDGAVDDEGEARALAAQQIVGDFLQRHQDRRAHQRPEQQPGAAERRHDQHLHRDQDAEAGFGIDEAEHHRIERAGDAGQPGAQHERIKLGAAGGRAERARGAFGILDGAQIKSHPAVGHPPGDAERDRRERSGTDSNRAAPR